LSDGFVSAGGDGCAGGVVGTAERHGKIHITDGVSQSEVTYRLDFSASRRVAFHASELPFLHHPSEE
jgi:hypothetical protein